MYKKRHINPKIRNLRPKKRFWKKPLFWIVLTAILIIAILWFALFYSKFQIKNIEIFGNEKVKTEDIQQNAFANLNKKILTTGFLNISSRSVFVVDTNNILKNLLNKFPEIESIQIQKKFPDSITLKVKERQPVAVFCQSADNCFLIDQNGVIFQKRQSTSSDMVITKEQSDKNIFAGENIIDKKIMDAILKVQNNLKNNLQVNVKEAFVSNPLIFTTSENWKIYFDPTENMDAQIIKMDALLKDQITPDARKKLQYIYLQYKDRAYYK